MLAVEASGAEGRRLGEEDAGSLDITDSELHRSSFSRKETIFSGVIYSSSQ